MTRCSVTVDDALHGALRRAARRAGITQDQLLYQALSAYLHTTRQLPEESFGSGAFIYLVGTDESDAVKVGKTTVPKARLSYYRSRAAVGYYAMWQLYPAHVPDLEVIEREILSRYGGPGSRNGVRTEGGVKRNTREVLDRRGRKHCFPFNTRELLALDRYEAVRALDTVIGERGFRVL
ncbi:MAG: hypothetical protein K6U78_04100 [Anaerolineae bacterium]|nr:hypothetical protein [Anaerolineae bacterium]